MPQEDQEDTTIYEVVVNHEEQYSIWTAERQPPSGWKTVGKQGLKADCLAYIEEVWTDMRPLSLRKQMAEMERRRAAGEIPDPPPREPPPEPNGPTPDALVDRLAEGQHPVEVGLRPEKTVAIFKECVDRGYVHIKFTGTKGGTELGVRLDEQASDFSQADFSQQTGRARIVGGLTLNYVKVRCVADIELSSIS